MSKTKLKAQVKSRFYYVFWGTATVAVVLGQLYVGTGVRVGFDGWNEGIIYDPLLDPQLYLGAQYGFSNAHYLKAEVDGLRRDVVVGYSYRKKKWDFRTQYSWRYNALDVGLKFYIIK